MLTMVSITPDDNSGTVGIDDKEAPPGEIGRGRIRF